MKRPAFLSWLLLASILTWAGAAEATSPPAHYDLILAGGMVFSGDGSPGHIADVGLRGDRIAAVGDLSAAATLQRLDVTGLAVTPGFIDLHSHAVRESKKNSGIFLWPDAENYIRQGVTSIIGGPDGNSWYPIDDLLEQLDKAPATVNFGTFVGHNRVRQEVMQRDNRAPTAVELRAMQNLVATAMNDGAFGLSSGLKYVPGSYSDTAEVIALARVAGEHGGIYITHMREEGLGLLESVAETIRIADEGGLPAQISHHKAMGASMWGRSVDSLAMVDAANARGLDISSDVYPYAASSTGIKVLFPAWSLAGDRQARLARLHDPETRAAIKAGLVENLQQDRGGNDLNRVVIAECKWDHRFNGHSLAQILQQRDIPQTMENAAELVMELEEGGSCSAVYHAMSDEDVDRIMQHPRTMIASDGGIFIPGPNVPHPRNYGSFARVLAVYVRQRGVLEFPEAIHKMSRMPADRIGLPERGRIEPGAFADLAVFDPDEFADTATFENPHQYAVGMQHVFVNGQAVLLKGEMTGARPGRVLRSAPASVLPQRVLLVGNSFTFYNNGLHTHLRNFLRTSGLPGKDRFAQKMMTISGARLAEHRAGLPAVIESFKPDVVVLQGHSMEPIDPDESAAFHSAVKDYAAIIRNHGAAPALLMTWAYTGKPEMTESLAEAYESAGAEYNIPVLPVGRAFALAEQEIPGIRLRIDDQKHPTLEGSYLAAAVTFAGLYGKSPEELPYTAGLPEELAQRLRQLAWRAVQARQSFTTH